MRIIVRPIAEPQREIDMTRRLVAAIAEELWRLFGGNDKLNWLEAERHLARIVGQVREEAIETAVVEFVTAGGSATSSAFTQPCGGHGNGRRRASSGRARAAVAPGRRAGGQGRRKGGGRAPRSRGPAGARGHRVGSRG